MTNPSQRLDVDLELVRDADGVADGGEDRSTDGRTMRRRRNRQAVIESLISLIREGDLNPTVAKIADRAEVSHRSVFRYFEDLNDLARTAIETEFRKTLPLGVIPDLGEGDLEHRIDTMVDRQLAVLGHTHALGRVARSRLLDLPEVDRGMANIAEFRLEQVRQQFAPELAGMDPAGSESIATAILMIISFESYDFQVRVLERTVDEVAANWRTALLALLG